MEAPGTDFSIQNLLRKLREDPRSSSEIARLTGISQPTISRLRLSDGRRMRRSGPFNKLCSFYGVERRAAGRSGENYNERLQAAIVDAWDGSDAHGRALLVVIEGLKGLAGKSDSG